MTAQDWLIKNGFLDPTGTTQTIANPKGEGVIKKSLLLSDVLDLYSSELGLDVTQCDACGRTIRAEDAIAGFDCDYCDRCSPNRERE